MDSDKRKFGIMALCGSLIGGMIGSAIFSLSGQTIVQAGPGAVLTWILAGLMMLFYGFICTELSTRYPVSGGLYIFPAKAFGSSLVGWISNWGSALANIVAVSFSSIYVSIYISVGFSLPDGAEVPLAVASILFCLAICITRNNVFSKANGALVGVLILTMLIYIALSFGSGLWDSSHFKPFLTQGSLGRFGFLRAVPVAMLGYGNIVAMAFLVSKAKDPARTLPRAVVISMLFVVGLYSLMIAATLGLVRVSYLQENPGLSFIPIYAACFTALQNYPWITKVVSVSAGLSLLTTMIILLQVTANGFAASADDGILPSVFRKRNKDGEPVVGMALVALPCIAIALFPSFTERLVSLGALFSVVSIVLNVVSLFKARRDRAGEMTCCGSSGGEDAGGDAPGSAPRKPSGLSAPEGGSLGGESGKPCSRLFVSPGGSVVPVLLLVAIFLCYLADITSGWQIWAYSAFCYVVGVLIYAFRRR